MWSREVEGSVVWRAVPVRAGTDGFIIWQADLWFSMQYLEDWRRLRLSADTNDTIPYAGVRRAMAPRVPANATLK